MATSDKFLTAEELRRLLEKSHYPPDTRDYNHLTEALLLQQENSKTGWPRLIKNLQIIKNCPRQKVNVNSVEVLTMLNPARKQSLTSTTFEKNPSPKKCFLCNLEEEQKGIGILNNKYIILANPGVTFRGDLTIASTKHENQILKGHFKDMIEIAKLLTNFSIFYNGAMAGASSTHFHFQGSYKNRLIGELQILKLLKGGRINGSYLTALIDTSSLKVLSVERFLRKTIVIITHKAEPLISFLKKFYECIAEVNKDIRNFRHAPDFGSYIKSMGIKETEGRMNIMLRYEPGGEYFICVVFPKLTNRPTFYFENDANKIILGFAIKESLGTIITFRKSDYEKLINNPSLIKKAYADTTLPNELFQRLIEKIKEYK